MHPEATSEKPGTCPKCGMDLVEEEERSGKEIMGVFKKKND